MSFNYNRPSSAPFTARVRTVTSRSRMWTPMSGYPQSALYVDVQAAPSPRFMQTTLVPSASRGLTYSAPVRSQRQSMAHGQNRPLFQPRILPRPFPVQQTPANTASQRPQRPSVLPTPGGRMPLRPLNMELSARNHRFQPYEVPQQHHAHPSQEQQWEWENMQNCLVPSQFNFMSQSEPVCEITEEQYQMSAPVQYGRQQQQDFRGSLPVGLRTPSAAMPQTPSLNPLRRFQTRNNPPEPPDWTPGPSYADYVTGEYRPNLASNDDIPPASPENPSAVMSKQCVSPQTHVFSVFPKDYPLVYQVKRQHELVVLVEVLGYAMAVPASAAAGTEVDFCLRGSRGSAAGTVSCVYYCMDKAFPKTLHSGVFVRVMAIPKEERTMQVVDIRPWSRDGAASELFAKLVRRSKAEIQKFLDI